MQIPVVIEHSPGNGYSARTGDPFPASVHGTSRDEVLDKIRELIEKKVHVEGTEVVPLEIPASDPWLRMKGMFKDDPLFDDWQRAIADYRRQVDEDLSIP